ncbi:MAG: methyltransferase domain-containing protein [Anaerolineae bacterium]|nr:methyltransferase domain-containing protein [Anaerolineae bacterium]
MDSKALSKARYNQHAQGYVESKSHAAGYDLDQLLVIANPQPDWTVLDVATGGGHTALKFAPRVAQVIASDLTPNMLAAARAFIEGKGVTNVRFEEADAENLPFEAARFDLVTCRIAPHHFPEVPRFVAEAVRVLKEGGLLLVQDQVLPEDPYAGGYVDAFEKLRDPSHHRAYAEAEWITMFEQAGLTVEHTEQVIKRHEFITWAERQGCTPATIHQLESLLRLAPPLVSEWLDTTELGTPNATFVNHHLLITGRK